MKKKLTALISTVVCAVTLISGCGTSAEELSASANSGEIAAYAWSTTKKATATSKPKSTSAAKSSAKSSAKATTKPKTTTKPRTTTKPKATATAKPITQTYIDGTSGANSSEGARNLFDANAATKWCVTNFDEAYVIWKVSSAVSIDGYSIVTANDNETETKRNPSSWILYGCNASSKPDKDYSGWKKITKVSNDKRLKDINYTQYKYSISTTVPKYKYFMLVITDNKGASAMQLSEFAIDYDGCNYSFVVEEDPDPDPDPNPNPNPIKKSCTSPYCDNGSCTKCGGSGYSYTYSMLNGRQKKACGYCNNGKCKRCGGDGLL